MNMNVVRVPEITLTVNCGALANGVDENTVTAILKDGSEYLSNITVSFVVTGGSATFSNGLTSITAVTNAIGEASVTLTDTVAENVQIIASANEMTAIKECSFLQESLSLIPPVIEGVASSNIHLENLPDPVEVLIIAWQGIELSQVLMLTLSGTDAAGFTVPDYNVTHTITDTANITINIPRAQFQRYGGEYDYEFGTLMLSYTIDGVSYPNNESIYHVYGSGSSGAKYKVEGTVERDNAAADGSDINVVAWKVTDESGAEVTGLSGRVSVTGSATMTSASSVDLPAVVTYTDTLAETVATTLVLSDGVTSGTVSLSFRETADSHRCKDFSFTGFAGLISFLEGFRFVKGKRYRLTVTSNSPAHYLLTCKDGYYFDSNMYMCISGTPDLILGEDAIFISPVDGLITNAITSDSYYALIEGGVVTACIDLLD